MLTRSALSDFAFHRFDQRGMVAAASAAIAMSTGSKRWKFWKFDFKTDRLS